MNKSKTFLRRRQKALQQRLDPCWQPVTSSPVLRGGNIHYEVAGRSRAVGCGGLGLIQAVVESVGLRQAIDEKVSLLKRRKPYHESDHVLALVFNILAGGRCIDDLQRHRSNEAFLDALGARRIPGATTAGDFSRRFDATSVRELMAAMRHASAQVWPPVAVLAVVDDGNTSVEVNVLPLEIQQLAPSCSGAECHHH